MSQPRPRPTSAQPQPRPTSAQARTLPWLLLGLAAGLPASAPGEAPVPKPPAPVAAVAAGVAAHPPEFGELAAVLARFPATDPIQGSLELLLSRQSTEEHWADQSRATVEVEDGPQGLKVGLSRGGARQALVELREQTLDPAKHTPLHNALQALSLNEVSGDLDCAAPLGQDLALAHAVSVQPAVYLGKPARLLVLTLPPRLSAEARKHIKNADSRLSIWIGADGVPLGAEKLEHTRGRFLVLFFESLRKQTWTFGHKGNRLFATRHEVDDSASGMGQDFRNTTVADLSLR
ncbi:MAG: hypothetical protein JOZ15_16715 [Acidobacteria bacterium]|nr:hypothetical protein [Acidobacteriota bacterium]